MHWTDPGDGGSINDNSFACNTQVRTLCDEFNRLSRIDNDLFTYESEVPKPSRCDKQTSKPTHNDLEEYEWKISYDECEKIYAEAMIFINKRLVKLIDVTVEQWLDLKYRNHMTMDENIKKGVISTWLIRSYKLQFKEYLKIMKQKDTYARDVDMEYDPSHLARGDDEVELSNKESSDPDDENLIDEDEVDKIFRIKTNVFDFETPTCKAFKEFNYLLQIDPNVLTKDIDGFKTYEEYKDDWIYEWNEDIPWVHEKPWTNNGVWEEPTPMTDIAMVETCLEHKIRNTLRYQNLEWYEALEDVRLKEEALLNKVIMDGTINEEEESLNETWRSGTNIRRFEMIKYSFGQDEDYVAIKEYEYDDLTKTNEDACRAYQNIFCSMDEGWVVFLYGDLAGKEIDKVVIMEYLVKISKKTRILELKQRHLKITVLTSYTSHLARNYTVKPRRRDAAYLQTQLLIAQKEEAGMQLQAEEFDLMAAAGDLDEIEEVNANCILMANLQQTSTSILRLTKLPSMTQIDQLSVEQSGGIVEQNPTTVEETHVYFESLYNNLAIDVEKVNMINRKMKETNAELTTELARYKNQEKCFEINQEIYDKLEKCYQKFLYQEQCLTKKINSLHLSSAKTIMTLNEEIANLNNQLSKEKSTISYLQQEKKKLKSDFKIHEDKLLDKQIQLENKIKELDNILALEYEIELLLRAVVSQDIMSIVQNPTLETSDLQTELERTKERFDNSYNDMQQKIERLQAQLGDLKGKSKDTPCASNTLDPLSKKLEDDNVQLEFLVLNYAKENAHLKTTYKNLFDSINVTQTQTKTIIDSLQEKLHNTIYENAKLRAQLFDKVSEQQNTTIGTSANTKCTNQSSVGKPFLQPLRNHFVVRQPNAFQLERPKRVPPKVAESKDLINPSDPSRVDNVIPNKPVKASVRTKPITVSQPSVIHKQNVNSNLNGLSSTGVDNTAKSRRPQPRSNTKNDRVPSASKSSCIKNKEVEVEEHPRNLLLSENKKHMSSECNNIKLAIRNDKFEVVCAMCKQCLITNNHAVCVLNYVNDMNSLGDKHSVNVSKIANQKKHKPKVKKPKNLGSKERLASPKPSKPRNFLRWSSTGRIFDLKGKIIASSKFECQSDCSKIENACTSNHQEPTSKWFPNSTFSLAGTIRFGNDHIAAILGYGDLQWGNILITKVYFVEGLGHNLFSVGQFCDSDLEVAFRRNTCFVRNLEGVDLLKGNRTTNLYTINLHEMAASSQFASWLMLLLPSLGYGLNNDRKDIRKLGAKGDIGFFIGYSANSCAYRVYNRRTKKLMETMNVTFDKLLAMAFEQRSSKPELQGMTSGQISLGLDLTYALSTITSHKPTERELDLLFEAMYDDYIGGQPSAALRTAPATLASQVLQTPTTSTTITDTAPTPKKSSPQVIPITSQDVDELPQQQHVQQQDNQAPLQPEIVADNVPNAMFDEDVFENPFAPPSSSTAESSSSQYMD
ncbi:hypothetical protein Tco_1509402 [Tanacetum coccineum]